MAGKPRVWFDLATRARSAEPSRKSTQANECRATACLPDRDAIELAYSMATTIRFAGSGPGPQTPDGCSVELWKLLPAGVEPSLIASAIPPRGSILELGAGVGRITHPLVALGYNVTAVDNSPEMVAEIHGAATVLSDIEELSLGISFDAVLLGSFLIHAPVPGTRAILLEVCRRHVKPSGVVLIQRYRDGWPARAVPGYMGEKDGIKAFIDDVAHDGRFVRITLRH